MTAGRITADAPSGMIPWFHVDYHAPEAKGNTELLEPGNAIAAAAKLVKLVLVEGCRMAGRFDKRGVGV